MAHAPAPVTQLPPVKNTPLGLTGSNGGFSSRRIIELCTAATMVSVTVSGVLSASPSPTTSCRTAVPTVLAAGVAVIVGVAVLAFAMLTAGPEICVQAYDSIASPASG